MTRIFCFGLLIFLQYYSLKVVFWLHSTGNCNAPTLNQKKVRTLREGIELSDWWSCGQSESSACRRSASKPFLVLGLQSLLLGAKGGKLGEMDFLKSSLRTPSFCMVLVLIHTFPSFPENLYRRK